MATRQLVYALGFTVLIVVGLTCTTLVNAQERGDAVDIIVPDGGPITTGDLGDVLIITGRSQGTTSVGTCAPAGDYHVQSGMIIDPGAGQRATRLTIVIAISQTTPLRNGTRLGVLLNNGPCVIGGVNYIKYRGTVE